MPIQPSQSANCRRAVRLGLFALLMSVPLQSALACVIPTPDLAAKIVADHIYRTVHNDFAPNNPVITAMPALCETCWQVRYKDGDTVFVRVPKRIHSMPYGEVVRFSSLTRSSLQTASPARRPIDHASAEIAARAVFSNLGTTATPATTSAALHPADRAGGEGGVWEVTGHPSDAGDGPNEEFVRVSLDASTGQVFAIENQMQSSLSHSKSCLIGQTAMWVFSVAALIGIAVMLVRRRRMGRRPTLQPGTA